MTFYEKLNIPQYWNKAVRITTDDFIYEGIMYDLINEDWEEDGEPEEIALDINGTLEGVILSKVKSIELIGD